MWHTQHTRALCNERSLQLSCFPFFLWTPTATSSGPPPSPPSKLRFLGPWYDKRATTNVQNGLVFLLLFSLIIFSSLWTKTVVKHLNSKKKSWRKNSEKLWISVKMCGKVCVKKCRDDFALQLSPFSFLWNWGRDMGGGGQNVWGEENVPENALSRKFLDPSKRASGLLCRKFLYRKNRALTPEGWNTYRTRGGSKTPFLGGVSFLRFSTPLFLPPPLWRPLK